MKLIPTDYKQGRSLILSLQNKSVYYIGTEPYLVTQVEKQGDRPVFTLVALMPSKRTED